MKKVLIIDDSATMRLLLRMSLRHCREVNITEAIDGLDGLEKLAAESFDLVITDVNMPRLDGLGLIEEVRNVQGLKMPIIILTTKGEEGDIEKGLSLGADNYVTKPIVGPAFSNLVENYVRAA